LRALLDRGTSHTAGRKAQPTYEKAELNSESAIKIAYLMLRASLEPAVTIDGQARGRLALVACELKDI
jgi:hypothetical protein